MANLQVKIGELELKNPLITAAGAVGDGLALSDYYPPAQLGGMVLRSVTFEPQCGYPAPRVAEATGGMLTSIGLENRGAEYVATRELPRLQGCGTAVIPSIAALTEEEYQLTAARFDKVAGLAALEINLACADEQGLDFGADPARVGRIISSIKAVTGLPLIAKLSPAAQDQLKVAEAAATAGALAVSLTAPLPGMAIDIEKRQPILGRGWGRLSGPAVKPLALHMVHQLSKNLRLPVIGMGGIACGTDAIEFMMAGACAFQVGAANVHDPLIAPRILSELNEWLDAHGVRNVNEIVGVIA